MSDLIKIFPGLSHSHLKVTSPEEPRYNCIAFAAEDDQEWWWPDIDSYWPPNVPREETISSFIAAFVTLGYTTCQDENYEDGFIKIAIFVDDNGVPTHAALQLANCKWTSKCGELEDIEHDLNALCGPNPAYGKIARYMKKPA
ncbi:MAG: hypothetical protein ABSA04_03680 [Desulfobaccales bacterium]|jgi:hypothetical protein